MQFGGNKDYELKTMDMFEIGYRWRPAKNILVDIEGFYNISEDFGALMPSYTNLSIRNPLGILTTGQEADVRPDSVHMVYQNLDLKSKQLGASINIDWVISEKLIANAHLTIQQTKLDNYLAMSRDEVIGSLVADALTNDLSNQQAAGLELQNLGAGLMMGTVGLGDIPARVLYAESSNLPNSTESDYDHKSSPSYYGGFSLTYRPTKKLEFFPQAYFYGEQKFENQYGTEIIDSKFLLNLKASYKATDNMTFYINGRNILNQDSREFAFMDQTPTLILAGLNFKF